MFRVRLGFTVQGSVLRGEGGGLGFGSGSGVCRVGGTPFGMPILSMRQPTAAYVL